MIMVGDQVVLSGSPARVVFVLDNEQFSPDYPKEEWSKIDGRIKGIGILTEKWGLLIENSASEDLVFVCR